MQHAIRLVQSCLDQAACGRALSFPVAQKSTEKTTATATKQSAADIIVVPREK
jgi:hypothetical protein